MPMSQSVLLSHNSDVISYSGCNRSLRVKYCMSAGLMYKDLFRQTMGQPLLQDPIFASLVVDTCMLTDIHVYKSVKI